MALCRAGEEGPFFEALTEGLMVFYDGGDGAPTPTPLRLVRLKEYAKAMGE